MNEKEKNITYTRSLILEIIGHNKEKEITRFTNITKSGIYLIYIDNFNDNKILPIYVGQTVNFQQRYREHLENLIEIDGCNSKEYIKNLKIQEYNGNYKYNKIFSYLLDHNCTLENLHMIILEETENLEEKEQYYISKLNSNIYGFNQLKSVTFWVANKKQCYSELTNGQYYPALFNGEYNIKDLFKEYVTKDILNYDIYKNYGYNKFNYFLLCQILNNLDNLLGLNEKELFNKILSDMLKEINLYIVSENLHINNYFDYINYLCEKWNEKNKTRKLIIEKILSNLKNLGISAHDLEKANGQVKKSIIQRLEILAGSKKYNTESSFLSYNTFYDFWEITSDNKFMKHSYNLISDDTLKINFKKEIEELKKILIAIDYFSWEIC